MPCGRRILFFALLFASASLLRAQEGAVPPVAEVDGTQPDAYLAVDGSLRHALILRDSQTGFAGDSGHLWTIEPDGAWRHQTFLNRTVRKPDYTGRFSKSQLESLAGSLARYDLLGLPEQMGTTPGVNPHVFAITFGKDRRALVGRGGACLPPADPKNAAAAEQRFASLVRMLQREMKSKGSEK